MVDPTRGVVLLINLIDYKTGWMMILDRIDFLTDSTINHGEEQPDSTSSLNFQSKRFHTRLNDQIHTKTQRLWRIETKKFIISWVKISSLHRGT